MGPIRAFSRPSHAAAPEHSATSARSLFCPTQLAFPHQHHHYHHHQSLYCSTVTPLSFTSQHPNPINPSLYSSALTSDPLGVGFISSSPESNPSLNHHHFKKFSPPVSSLADTLPVETSLSQTQVDGVREGVVKEGGSHGICKESKQECELTGIEIDVQNLMNGGYLHSKKNSNVEVNWKKDNNQNKWKSSISRLNVSKKEVKNGSEHSFEKSHEDESSKKEKLTSDTGCSASLLTKHDEPLPTTSRVALIFPFSEDEEDDDGENSSEGCLAGCDNRRVTWPISDIIETEDEGECVRSEIEIDNADDDTSSVSLRNVIFREDNPQFNKYGNEIEDIHLEKEKEESEEKIPTEKLNWGNTNTKLIDLSVSSLQPNLVSVVIKNPQVFGKPDQTLKTVGTAKTVVKQTNEDNVIKGDSSHLYEYKKETNYYKNLDSESSLKKHLKHEDDLDHLQVNKKCKNYHRGNTIIENNTEVVNGNNIEVEKEESCGEKRRVGLEEIEEDGKQGMKREEEEDEELGEDAFKDGVRATQRLRPRSYRQFLLTRERRSRVFLKERSYHLGRWFVTHFTHPYPSKEQKDALAAKAKMTRNQVSEWFGNMRRRIREATRGHGICWEERVRLYNSVITGKSEPLPILPEDDINTWVPPASYDAPITDSQEEMDVSPKFKRKLLHRYLNNSESSDVTQADASLESMGSSLSNRSTVFSNNIQCSNVSKEGKIGRGREIEATKIGKSGDLCLNFRGNCSGAAKITQPMNKSFPNNNFTYSLPLCTSSPKENIKELWNSSFEHIKDNYQPSIHCKTSYKDFKPIGQPNSFDAIKKGKKQETPFAVGNGKASVMSKKKKTSSVSNTDCSLRPSTSNLLAGDGSVTLHIDEYSRSQIVAGRNIPLTIWSITRPLIDHSRVPEVNASAQENLRQPEELDAAYSLMQLQNM